MLCSLFLTIIILNDKGVASRVYLENYDLSSGTAPVHFLNNSQDFISFYKSRNIHGRVLINISSLLHFRGISSDEFLTKNNDKFPLLMPDTLMEYQERVNLENFLWVALQSNIFRAFYHLIPEDEFDTRSSTVQITDRDVSSISNDTIVAHKWGSKRIVAKHLNRFSEPVLINIDASYFVNIEPQALVDELKEAELTVDFITLNLSEDDPYLTDAERDKLNEFALLISK
jgi:hypothetical protein